MNSSSNYSTDFDTLRLAFVEGLPASCLSSSTALLQCSDWRLRLSGYYLQLLWPNKPFTISIFPSVSKVWDALENGDVDAYLIGHPLDDKLIRRVYATSMLYRSVDVMFTKAPAASVHSENPTWFWISTFTWETWLSVIAVLILMVLVHLLIQKITLGHIRKITSVFRPVTPIRHRQFYSAENEEERYYFTKKCFEACFLIFALFFTIYDSNVKAMLYTVSINAPFRSITDLADQIRQGQKRMVLERKDTDRWRMLNNINETDYATVKYLRNAVVEMNALTFIPDVNELCRQLSLNPQLVYFGSEKITESSCPEYCLWKYDLVQEELAKPVYYVISKKTLKSGKLRAVDVDMYLHAMHNYGTVISRRGHYTGDCSYNFAGAAYINYDSIVVIVYLILILSGGAALLFIGELIWWRMCQREQTRMHGWFGV